MASPNQKSTAGLTVKKTWTTLETKCQPCLLVSFFHPSKNESLVFYMKSQCQWTSPRPSIWGGKHIAKDVRVSCMRPTVWSKNCLVSCKIRSGCQYGCSSICFPCFGCGSPRVFIANLGARRRIFVQRKRTSSRPLCLGPSHLFSGM